MSRKIQRNDPETAPDGDKALAIMQPYFLPYIGYWQLMRSVDEFVVYDDVQFSKGGWINRNRLLLNGAAHTFTVPLRKGNLGDRIDQRQLSEGYGQFSRSLLDKVAQAYSGAPQYARVMPVIEQILATETSNLADFLFHALEVIRKQLGICTPLLRSSELGAGEGLRASERVLAICTARGARTYVNAPGGRDLYDREVFRDRGITLKFLCPGEISYSQFGADFVPSLSILDVMMFNDPGEIDRMLSRYTLD